MDLGATSTAVQVPATWALATKTRVRAPVLATTLAANAEHVALLQSA